MSSPLKVTILGCHSATPKTKAYPTAQIVEVRGQLLLIDCGEGTQVRLRENSVKFSQVKHIFISHLHGDHFYGLIGLLSTLSLLNRTTPINIYAPTGAKEIVHIQLKYSGVYLTYPLNFIELKSTESELICDEEKFYVKTIPLDHRIYTNGFFIVEKEGRRKLNLNKVEDLNIDKAYYQKITKGEDIALEDGTIIKNEEITFPPNPPKSYAFCSDTTFQPSIIPIIKNATALYHESTFLELHKALSAKTKHSTAKEAATIAKEAQVGHLILGHYSARYKHLEDFKIEAETIFKPVSLAQSGKTFSF
jgi:ribonuclease Z